MILDEVRTYEADAMVDTGSATTVIPPSRLLGSILGRSLSVRRTLRCHVTFPLIIN
jgi:hypothetical protein